jgi:hypothetical protein
VKKQRLYVIEMLMGGRKGPKSWQPTVECKLTKAAILEALTWWRQDWKEDDVRWARYERVER